MWLISSTLVSCQATQTIKIYFYANGGTFPGGKEVFELNVKSDKVWGEILTEYSIPEPTKAGKNVFDHWSKSEDELVSPDLNDTFVNGAKLYAHY